MTMPSPTADPAASLDGRAALRIGVAGVLGTVIEYFEFATYGFLAVVIGPLFFPTDSRAAGVLYAFLVFATGYVIRPLGGIYFGRLGDRKGRRAALTVTVLGMGGASTALGLLPTYATAGALAPVLLIAVRMIQGFSAGGEIIGSVTYLAEAAPPRKAGLFSALTPGGASLGTMFAALVAAVVTTLTTSEQLSVWGWRIPFLLCLPLMVVTLVIRMRLEDSPTFKVLVATSKIEKAPVRTVLRNFRGSVAKVAGVAMVINIVGAVGTTYITAALISNAGFPPGQVYFVSAGAALVGFCAMLLAGQLGQKYGRRPVLLASLVMTGIYAIPAFLVLRDTRSILVVLVVLVVWNLLSQLQSPPSFGTFAAIFPPWIRYTGAALGFNIGVVLGAGLTPYVSQLMLTTTGDQASAAYLVVGGALVGVLIVLTLPKGTVEDDRATESRRLAEADSPRAQGAVQSGPDAALESAS
jgi:MFS transporter, MHS family, proline/betaine transporter